MQPVRFAGDQPNVGWGLPLSPVVHSPAADAELNMMLIALLLNYTPCRKYMHCGTHIHSQKEKVLFKPFRKHAKTHKQNK